MRISLWFSALLMALPASGSNSLSAPEIMERNFTATKIQDAVSSSTFTLINESGGKRVRQVRGFSKVEPKTSNNRRLVIIDSPADVKGTKTLMIENTSKEDEFFIYLPDLRKVRRLVASNKRDSFAGTDFSYGDIMGHKPGEWNHKLLREENVGGKDTFVVESVPQTKEVAENTGYSKRMYWIDKESFVAVKIESYDLSGGLLKRTVQSKITKIDVKNNKWQPLRLECQNLQTQHRTVIEHDNYRANVGLKDDLFSARTLEKQ